MWLLVCASSSAAAEQVVAEIGGGRQCHRTLCADVSKPEQDAVMEKVNHILAKQRWIHSAMFLVIADGEVDRVS